MIRTSLALLCLALLLAASGCGDKSATTCPATNGRWEQGVRLPELGQFVVFEIRNYNKIYYNKQRINAVQLQHISEFLSVYVKKNPSEIVVLNYEKPVNCTLLKEMRKRIDKAVDCGRNLCIENMSFDTPPT